MAQMSFGRAMSWLADREPDAGTDGVKRDGAVKHGQPMAVRRGRAGDGAGGEQDGHRHSCPGPKA